MQTLVSGAHLTASTDTLHARDAAPPGPSPLALPVEQLIAVGVADEQVYRRAMPLWRFKLRQRVMRRLEDEMQSIQHIQVSAAPLRRPRTRALSLSPDRVSLTETDRGPRRRTGGHPGVTSTLSRPALQAPIRELSSEAAVADARPKYGKGSKG